MINRPLYIVWEKVHPVKLSRTTFGGFNRVNIIEEQ
jgi:hypothetical protein